MGGGRIFGGGHIFERLRYMEFVDLNGLEGLGVDLYSGPSLKHAGCMQR